MSGKNPIILKNTINTIPYIPFLPKTFLVFSLHIQAQQYDSRALQSSSFYPEIHQNVVNTEGNYRLLLEKATSNYFESKVNCL